MSKNIIICSDGTGNEFGTNNTNVVLTYQLAVQDDKQIAFYDPGVGTGGWEYEDSWGDFRAKSDGATGEGLQNNVNDAYRILMEHYQEDDHIYLFGFSRGAFTARAIAGMLNRVGLMRPGHGNLLEYASKLYNTTPDDDPNIDTVCADFKATFSIDCSVHFIGVWDTVDSRMLNANKKFADAKLNPTVSNAFHAIAIDEKRSKFPVLMWEHENGTVGGQTVEQVWFAGVHSDVGGWYDERGLSNHALHWMLGKASDCGMKVKDDLHTNPDHQPDHEGKMHESYEGFWKLLGSDKREIAPGSWVHKSVIDRKGDPNMDYAPSNLPGDIVVVS